MKQIDTYENEESDIIINEFFKDVNNEELSLPDRLPFLDIMDEAAKYYAAGLQDLIDGSIQIQFVSENVDTHYMWHTDIMQEIFRHYNVGEFEDYIKLKNIYDEQSVFVSYVDDISRLYYDNIIELGEYGIVVQYIIAKIEHELQESMTPIEYNALIKALKDNSSVNSMEAFLDHISETSIVTSNLTRFGFSMMMPGKELLLLLKNEGIKKFISKDHWNLLTKGVNNFVSGNGWVHGKKNPAKLNTRYGNSLLMSSISSAAVTFALYETVDFITGNISAEKTAVNAAKGVVSGIGAAVGNLVTDAIYLEMTGLTAAQAAATGLSAGSFAGVPGIIAGTIVAVVGNYLVDKVYYNLKHASNGLPKPNDYKEITPNDIKQMLEEQGYLVSVPKFGSEMEESVFDFLVDFPYKGADEKFVRFLEQKVYGFSVNVMEPEEYQHCLTIFNRFKRDLQFGYIDINDPGAYDHFMESYMSQCWDKYEESDNDYIANLFNFFSSDDPEIKSFLNDVVNNKILDTTTFDYNYEPTYEE